MHCWLHSQYVLQVEHSYRCLKIISIWKQKSYKTPKTVVTNRLANTRSWKRALYWTKKLIPLSSIALAQVQELDLPTVVADFVGPFVLKLSNILSDKCAIDHDGRASLFINPE